MMSDVVRNLGNATYRIPGNLTLSSDFGRMETPAPIATMLAMPVTSNAAELIIGSKPASAQAAWVVP